MYEKVLMHSLFYEVLSESPELCQKINAGLTYSIMAAISFKIVSLGTYTTIPSFFLHFKSTVEVILVHVLSTACDSLQMSDTVSKRRPFRFIFNMGNKAKSQGAKSDE
jgi:hypothetical protein